MVRTTRLELYNSEIPFLPEGARAPTLEVFIPSADKATGYGMLAFPGGSYSFLSPKSGVDYGAWFAERGITVVVVNFRLGSEGANGQAICCDALTTMQHVKENASDWCIDLDRTGVIGTSAGGHLAGCLATGIAQTMPELSELSGMLDLKWRPSFAVYCYSVLSLMEPLAHNETRANFLGPKALSTSHQYAYSPIKHVMPDQCRSFIWHTIEDTEVAASNSTEYAAQLQANGVPLEFHLYQKGPHALGLAKNLKNDVTLCWRHDCLRWILESEVEEV
ncbi:alpha/beta hydrolase [Endozoicomonas acroporae]|uniref:alpha/beta hydrolase n=1 Tax=Endozoicomonas acroporae TaxID=1701104 RepID=UPI003D7B0B86